MTVIEYIKQLLPQGTQVMANGAPSWDEPPDWPPNLFAVAALLIERLDLLAHWEPADASALVEVRKAQAVGETWVNVDWSAAGGRDAVPLTRKQQRHKNLLRRWWRTLCTRYGATPIAAGAIQQDSALARELTSLAVRMVAVSDEACAWVGYGFSASGDQPADDDDDDSLLPADFHQWMRSLLAVVSANEARKRGQTNTVLGLTTLTLRLSPVAGTVLPKARTPSVGCTLRALSHNLALLPPDTQVLSVWRYDPRLSRGSSPRGGFNLLIVPFPYRIEPGDFVESRSIESGRSASFELRQSWLPQGTPANAAKQFCDWLVKLIRDAQRHAPVHGVVFPELALSKALFDAASRRLQHLARPARRGARAAASASRVDVELFVAGITDEARSNRVATAIYYPGDRGVVFANPLPQSKHHRWKIDRRQLTRYGLSGVLRDADDYWEDLKIDPREVHFHTFRDDSVLCCLICEDLARLDPCQPVVRAVGPNLVIALLMDGPQIKERWPARYATVLAEDPGSSVLTVSSVGLMELSARLDGNAKRSVALWKSSSEDARSLELPPGHQALLASLYRRQRRETTLDGRHDDETAVEWNLESVIPVVGARPSARWPRS